MFELAFIPLKHVNETFEYTVENSEENVYDLIDYAERVHVCGRCGRGKRRPEAPRFLPETWHVYRSVLNGNNRMKPGAANF